MSQHPRTPVSSPAFLTPGPRLAPSVVRGTAAVLLVVLFGLLVARSFGMTQTDLTISKALNGLHTGVLGAGTSAVYSVFGPAPAIVITAVVAAIIWLVSRSLRQGITFGIVVAVTWLPSALVKVIVDRTRPDAALLAHPFSPQPVDASYPSGHAVFITALVMALFLLARGRPIRLLVVVLGAVLVAVVALALVIDGVHYPSDVIASILWSIGLAPLVLEIWNRVVLPRTYRARRNGGMSA